MACFVCIYLYVFFYLTPCPLPFLTPIAPELFPFPQKSSNSTFSSILLVPTARYCGFLMSACHKLPSPE